MRRTILIEARKRKKMSQGDLAKIVGIHPSIISHFERGVRNPSMQMAFKIAAALGESVDRLWGEGDKIKKVLNSSPRCVKINGKMQPKSRLAEIRKKIGLTQKELSNKSGVSLNMISYIERGVRVPRMEIAKKLCKALVVRLDDI